MYNIAMEKDKLSPTEARNSRTHNLDSLAAADMIKLINREDMQTVLAVKKAAPRLEIAVKETAKRFAQGGKIIFIGAGTSGRLGVLEAAECPPTFSTDPKQIIAIIAGGKSSVFRAKEGAEDSFERGAKDISKSLKKSDIVFGIAASGHTPYVLGALKAAKKAGAYTNLITSNGLADKKSADNIIYLATGPEVLQGSTRMKAATAAKMTLNIITTAAMALCGKMYKNYMVDVKASNQKLRQRALRLVCELAGARPAQAEEALKKTGYKVKDAIIMLKLNIPTKQARALLKKHDGRLKNLL